MHFNNRQENLTADIVPDTHFVNSVVFTYYVASITIYLVVYNNNIVTIFVLISGHPLISGHSHFLLVETGEYCVTSSDQNFLLINHPPDGAMCIFCGLCFLFTHRQVASRVFPQDSRRSYFVQLMACIVHVFALTIHTKCISFDIPIKGTRHKQNSLSGNTLFNYMPTYTRSEKIIKIN